MEMMFGSGSPMWTATPSLSLGYQPLAHRQPCDRAASLQFASAQWRDRWRAGRRARIVRSAESGGSGFVAGYLYALNPSSPDRQRRAGFVTASSLLTAVALRRGQPQGPSNYHEIEDFIYDALELFPGAADVEVRCENGRATLTGTVQHKHTKRDVGEIAWAIPGVQDVQNNVLDYIAAPGSRGWPATPTRPRPLWQRGSKGEGAAVSIPDLDRIQSVPAVKPPSNLRVARRKTRP